MDLNIINTIVVVIIGLGVGGGIWSLNNRIDRIKDEVSKLTEKTVIRNANHSISETGIEGALDSINSTLVLFREMCKERHQKIDERLDRLESKK